MRTFEEIINELKKIENELNDYAIEIAEGYAEYELSEDEDALKLFDEKERTLDNIWDATIKIRAAITDTIYTDIHYKKLPF